MLKDIALEKLFTGCSHVGTYVWVCVSVCMCGVCVCSICVTCLKAMAIKAKYTSTKNYI